MIFHATHKWFCIQKVKRNNRANYILYCRFFIRKWVVFPNPISFSSKKPSLMSLATLPAIFYRQHWPHWKRFQKNKRQESSFFSPIQIGIKRIKKKKNQRSTCTRSRRRKGEEIHKFKSLLHLVEGKSPFDWWDGKTSLKARHVVLPTYLYSI